MLLIKQDIFYCNLKVQEYIVIFSYQMHISIQIYCLPRTSNKTQPHFTEFLFDVTTKRMESAVNIPFIKPLITESPSTAHSTIKPFSHLFHSDCWHIFILPNTPKYTMHSHLIHDIPLITHLNLSVHLIHYSPHHSSKPISSPHSLFPSSLI